jgi:hypothetical protein
MKAKFINPETLPLRDTLRGWSIRTGIDQGTFRRHCRAGQLAFEQVGTIRIISRDALLDWASNQSPRRRRAVRHQKKQPS